MKKLIGKTLLIIAISYMSLSAVNAQDTLKAIKKAAKKITYILPDGSVLGPGGFDSLKKVWGNGRVTLIHSSKDDEMGITHVVRVTDEMQKQFAEQAAEQREELQKMIGQPAIDFSLTDIKGQKWTLSELKGKVVVLNFWFTSCPPCIQEMPDLNKLTKAYEADNVVFLAVTFNTVEKVIPFLNEHEFNYNILADAQSTATAYHVSSWPTSIVIDKQGKVAFTSNYSPNIYEDIAAVIDKSK